MSISGFGPEFKVKLKSRVPISGFGWKFGTKLESGGVGFRIWVEIWSEIEIGGCRFQDLGRNFE